MVDVSRKLVSNFYRFVLMFFEVGIILVTVLEVLFYRDIIVLLDGFFC